MKKKSLLDDYLRKYSAGDQWELIADHTDHVSQVVVIPAYAEKEMLFHTLASLAGNEPRALEETLIICVVNNKINSPAAVIENNSKTINVLDALIKKKSSTDFEEGKYLINLLKIISESKMKLGYIDASSAAKALPHRMGGVGMARKIGMDMALRVLNKGSLTDGVILCLDADTLVQENYLHVVRDHFKPKVRTAIVAYEHPMPNSPREQAAICCYEIFLRYWVLGLKYAQSPWAFHSIGSTIAVSTDAYLAVRGMNKREAGEDFYFLGKLAKIGGIDYLKATCVYPSARVSTRVPFGTGKRMERFLTGVAEDEYRLYDPQIFSVLADLFRLMNDGMNREEEEILLQAQLIHPGLKCFLESAEFPLAWSKIRRVAKKEKSLAGHFHVWFDSFRTLKMIHYFTKEFYPPINMFAALKRLFDLSGFSGLKSDAGDTVPPLNEQREIPNYMRTIT